MQFAGETWLTCCWCWRRFTRLVPHSLAGARHLFLTARSESAATFPFRIVALSNVSKRSLWHPINKALSFLLGRARRWLLSPGVYQIITRFSLILFGFELNWQVLISDKLTLFQFIQSDGFDITLVSLAWLSTLTRSDVKSRLSSSTFLLSDRWQIVDVLLNNVIFCELWSQFYIMKGFDWNVR